MPGKIGGIVPMKRLCVVAAIMLVASSAQATLITSFDNLDFDDNTQNVTGGFDNVAVYDVPGWSDLNAVVTDAGSEAGAWWPTVDGYAAFMASGDGAYTMSTYTIQAGDVYQIDFYAMQWQWTGAGEWTASLFYDDPANVIGSFTQGGLPDNGSYTAYSSTPIAATPASVGGTLGILMTSTGTGIAQVDEITVDVVPEPATIGMLGLCGVALMFVRRRVR